LLIEKLNYDTEYLEKKERMKSFGRDIRSLLRDKEGTVGNFKPVLHEGKHLECRGCLTMWDKSKVLILTIRDISNWAKLEKAAKQDSANKTALIRSVSHELRTPVNAIINLCQDLQSSETIGEQDREDVEVLVNASSFLLSMINDLLDYSRILHDKFELVRTNFDLKRLIKGCGQLIALQCKQKFVDFLVRYDPLLPRIINSDENRLKQVILNLLSNAVK
jgi:signal transduction histidine kinase